MKTPLEREEINLNRLRDRVADLEGELRAKGEQFKDEIKRTHKKCLEWRERGDRAEAKVAELEGLHCVCDEESGQHEPSCIVIVAECLENATEELDKKVCEIAGLQGRAIGKALALGWESENPGDEKEGAALDWLGRQLESVRGWWNAALKQRDAAQDREKAANERVAELEGKVNHEVYYRDKVAAERDKADARVAELEKANKAHNYSCAACGVVVRVTAVTCSGCTGTAGGQHRE